MYRQLMIFILLVVTAAVSFAQVTPEIQTYRDDEQGEFRFRREGLMDGNQIRTLYYNNGEVGQWPYSPSGEWPKGTGHNYLDGVCVLIASQVTNNGQTFHPLETSYREWMDFDKLDGTIWGLEPVPFYANPQSEDPAVSTNTFSWPNEWPDALDLADDQWINIQELEGEEGVDDDRDGFVDNYTYWFGYFGRGVINSDFETFFVMDDSKDMEFTRPPFSYFPIADDSTRGGLGLRIEVRGFQWSHVLAEDIIFWHYDIVNISDHDYDTTAFGFYTDTGVGGQGDNGDDNASYDLKLDLAYAFDNDGIAPPGAWETGYYGYAYLESPGNPHDGLDNDEDGFVDEKRDDGIDNDGDWVGFSDLNGNGSWDADENEPLNNDVGADGVGPFDLQYKGPDEGEGDGLPTAGEPNFDQTDIDESDMIGLTSLSIYRLGDGGTGGGWPKDDEPMWLRMKGNNFDTLLQNSNISMVFASTPFPLNQGARERFSMALVFGSDLEDLVFNKETVQQIYNANYNFSRPPLKPTLTAVPGDGKVFLYWDDIAEESRDPFLGYENNDPTQGYKKDFEGYLIYRSEEAEFNDIKIITDSRGEPKYYRPLAQYDLINDIKGPDPVGINGASFFRGRNTGLRHTYVDSSVVNGRRYYYAVVSYDMGDDTLGTAGLTPSECTKIITEDFTGVLKFVDINCAVVTPNAPAAGYSPPGIVGTVNEVEEGIGSGSLQVVILNPAEIEEGSEYKVAFESTGEMPGYQTSGMHIIKLDGSLEDTLMTVPQTEIGAGSFSQPFNGLTLAANNDTTVGVKENGWLVGLSDITMNVVPDTNGGSKNIAWPSDYELVWLDDTDPSYVPRQTPFFKIETNIIAINTSRGDTVDIEIWDNDASKSLTIDDEIIIIEYVEKNGNPRGDYRLTWNISYKLPPGIGVSPTFPVAGDRYVLKTSKQFFQGDYFTFSTEAANIDKQQAKNDLKKISVVPNPYVGQASWERRNLNQSGRGERRIDFINLPGECTIRIYNIAGSLVRTLDKFGGTTDGTLSWNLVTEDGMDAAYGIYIYHVDAPGIGEHIGKFALIK